MHSTKLEYCQYGQRLVSGGSSFLNVTFNSISDKGTFICSFESLPLLPESYKLHLWCGIHHETSDLIEDAGSFNVVPTDVFGNGRFPEPKHGIFVLRYSWSNEEIGQ